LAITPRASNTTATRIDGIAAFFIAHLVLSVIYHADRDKGKCDLHGVTPQGFVKLKGQSYYEIELYNASIRIHLMKSYGCPNLVRIFWDKIC
jgi:hypothetical protein